MKSLKNQTIVIKLGTSTLTHGSKKLDRAHMLEIVRVVHKLVEQHAKVIPANGHRLQRGMVAVDPDVIPLGTQLYIEGYGYAVADDTGGAIVGNRIDLAMDSTSEAENFGRRDVVVYVL